MSYKYAIKIVNQWNTVNMEGGEGRRGEGSLAVDFTERGMREGREGRGSEGRGGREGRGGEVREGVLETYQERYIPLLLLLFSPVFLPSLAVPSPLRAKATHSPTRRSFLPFPPRRSVNITNTVIMFFTAALPRCVSWPAAPRDAWRAAVIMREIGSRRSGGGRLTGGDGDR